MRIPKLRYVVGTAFVSIIMSTFLLGVARVDASDEERYVVLESAAAITRLLDSADLYGARTVSREYWDRLGANGSAQRAIKEAEKVLKTDPPIITEELYKEYYNNGNRSRYQSAFGQAQSRFIRLALAEQFENQGRFIEPLNVELTRFCDLVSWVLPAHDRNAKIYDGEEIYSDLGSTLAAANVAIAVNLHQEKLDPKVVDRAKSEIERRVLQPYERAVKEAYQGMWWVRTKNNWNAVCHAGTVVAALNIVDSPERRAFFIAGADYFSEKYFMKGFTKDGYCSEGMGYWNYGFGHYLYLGAAARVASKGKLDFFRFDTIHAILDYAPTLEIDDGLYAVFADCSPTARPDKTFVGYLSRLKRYGYSEFESEALGEAFQANDLLKTTTIGFDEEVVFAENASRPHKYHPPIRTEFSDAGVVICRPAADVVGKYFAIAFKGGHNGEMHNHNDVGSYSLVLGDAANRDKGAVYISRDPGGETYTARTFSANRYDGQLLNSFGHPVPRINGVLQSPGAQYKGVVVEKSFSDEGDVVTFDITSAYPEAKTLDKASRTFRYRRAHGDDPGDVMIIDSIAFKEGETGEIETALISFEKEIEIESKNNDVEIKLAGAVVKVSALDSQKRKLKLVGEQTIVGETDASVPKKPTRIALRVDGDVNNATITQRFEAL